MSEAESRALVVASPTQLKIESKGELIREAFVFQLKLAIDGFKDIILVPIVFVALALDLMGSTDVNGRNLRRVFRMGHGFDRWLDLYKVGRESGESKPDDAGGFDDQLDGVERLLRKELAPGQLSAKAKAALKDMLESDDTRN